MLGADVDANAGADADGVGLIDIALIYAFVVATMNLLVQRSQSSWLTQWM